MGFSIASPYVIGGLISILFFGTLFVASSWRLLGVALGWNDTQHRFYVHKIIFHIVYSMYTLFELLYSVSMIVHQEIVIWGYTLHVVALFLNLGLFLMLINVWGILLQDSQKTQAAAIALILINFGSIIWAIADMHHNANDISDFLTSPAYFTLLCANAFAKFSLCILILIFGHQLQQTLQVSQTLLDSMTAEEVSIKLLLLRRIKVVLGVFTFCYFCRVFILIILVLSDNSEGTGSSYIVAMPTLIWFLVSWWIPNMLPNIIFLAMMKMPFTSEKKKQKTSDGVVVNKMFAAYETDRDSCPPGMESYMDDEAGRESDVTMMSAITRASSREVQMGRITSQDSKAPSTQPSSYGGWALM